jgi:hypothetical protein
MQGFRFSLLFGCVLAVAGAEGQTATPFTITATNVTMPSSGNGFSQFSVTNIPQNGTMNISTSYVGTDTGARRPTCANTPPVVYQVKAGGTLTGTIACYPYGAAVPAGLPQGRRSSRAGVGLALAGALLLGCGFRRSARRWLALVSLAVGALAGLAGISSCGGNPNAMTPGTYQLTISADNEGTVTPLGVLATTTIDVTVP